MGELTGRSQRRKRILRAVAWVVLVIAAADCAAGVVVGLGDGWRSTVDGVILESVGCIVAAVALTALIGGHDG